MLDVKFYHQSKWFRSLALVDSGADHISLNKDHAANLSIQWDKGIKSETRGISGAPADMCIYTRLKWMS